MIKSYSFLEDHPAEGRVWLLRAAVAIELDYPGIAWVAGRRLKDLGLSEGGETQTRKVMAQLERKGSLGDCCGDESERWGWSVPRLQTEANAGDAEAQLVLARGVLIATGAAQMTANDGTQVFSLLNRAAAQGDPQAQNEFGDLYASGRVVLSHNYADAMRWYRKSADQGYSVAQYNVAHLYASALGVPQDQAEAMRWYVLAAKQGAVSAQIRVYEGFRLGKGVKEEPLEAMRWLHIASAKALEIHHVDGENEIAWTLSTDLDSRFRNGSEAIKLAQDACDRRLYHEPNYVNTLAAAYAELGQFDKAVETQQRAIDVLLESSGNWQKEHLRREFQEHLELYRQKQPYRTQAK